MSTFNPNRKRKTSTSSRRSSRRDSHTEISDDAHDVNHDDEGDNINDDDDETDSDEIEHLSRSQLSRLHEFLRPNRNPENQLRVMIYGKLFFKFYNQTI
jgi:hypothetical protein